MRGLRIEDGKTVNSEQFIVNSKKYFNSEPQKINFYCHSELDSESIFFTFNF